VTVSGAANPSAARALPDAPASTTRTIPPPAAVAPTASLPSSGSGQERLQMAVPHVNVKLLGPAELTAGVPVHYTIVAENVDQVAAEGLILRMEAPAGVDVVGQSDGQSEVDFERAEDGALLVTWSVPGLKPGAVVSLPLQIQTAQPRNFAVAFEWTVLPQVGLQEFVVHHAQLQLSLEGPAEVEKDVPNVYRLRVSNPGTAMARGVKLQVGADSQDASAVDLGELAAGASEVIEMDLTFEKAGPVRIVASGTADGGLKQESQIEVAVRQAILGAGLSAPATVALGEVVPVTVIVQNTGDAAARGIQAGLVLPQDAEVLEPSAGMQRQGDKLMWRIEAVGPGESSQEIVRVKLAKPGVNQLKFVCVSPSGNVSTADLSTTVEAFSDLKLSVNDPASPAQVGAPVAYELTITNRGTLEANNVAVLAQFSDGIEPESAAGAKHRLVPGQVLFEPIATIAPGQTVTLQVMAKAGAAGIHRFRAEVRCENNDIRLVEEDSTRFLDSNSRIASPPASSVIR
jgi:hypothetical protein